MPHLPAFDAVVVAGGGARRLGGIDKAELIFRGQRLLDRVIQAVAEAERIVVVGPPRPTAHPVVWAREQPEGGGPVAALDAGMAFVEAALVVVVAVDLPLLDGAFVGRLVRAADEVTSAVAVDDEGTEQPLLGCYATGPLRTVLQREPTEGRSMKVLLHGLACRTIPDEGRSRDCDTASDMEELQIQSDGGGHAGRLA